jgi:hypothetical protein
MIVVAHPFEATKLLRETQLPVRRTRRAGARMWAGRERATRSSHPSYARLSRRLVLALLEKMLLCWCKLTTMHSALYASSSSALHGCCSRTRSGLQKPSVVCLSAPCNLLFYPCNSYGTPPFWLSPPYHGIGHLYLLGDNLVTHEC